MCTPIRVIRNSEHSSAITNCVIAQTWKYSFETSSTRRASERSPKAHARDMRIALDIKPPRLVFVFAGIIDADSRTCADRTRFEFPVFNPYCCAEQILTV